MYLSYITPVYELTNHNVPKKYNLKINQMVYCFRLHYYCGQQHMAVRLSPKTGPLGFFTCHVGDSGVFGKCSPNLPY